MARLSRIGDSHRFVFEFRRKSGTTGRALASVALVEVDGAVSLVGFLSDLHALDALEEEILERDARLAFIERAASVGLWDWDLSTGAVRLSPELERICGLPAGTFGGRYGDFAALVHPDDLAQFERNRDEIAGGEGPFDVEFRLRRPDGTVRWVQARGAKSLLPGEAGRVVVGITADVTARKLAELALRESEQRLAAATAVSPLTFFAQDRDLRYLWLKDPRLGLVPEQVVGRTDEDAFGEAVAAPLVTLKRRVLATATGVREEIRVQWQGRVGWFDMIVEPRRDAHGEVVGVIGAAADITARKEAEIALRTSETRLAAALKISQLIVFTQDRDLRYTWIANPGFGTSPADVIGHFDEEIMHPEDAASITLVKRRVLATGRGERHEVRVRRGDQAGWYDLIVEPDRDAAGGVVGVVCAAADITVRKQAEADAVQAHRQLAQLAAHRQDALEAERAALAREVHDQLGAALTGLRLRLEGLAGRLPGPQVALREDLLQMAAAAEAAQGAARAICADLRPPSLDDLGLGETCRWYLRDWGRAACIRTSGRFPRLPAEPPPEMAVDLFRVFQELLTNVARHARATAVKAGLSAGAGGLRLRVADDGIGMTDGGGGHGWGLVGIRERAVRHGGRVEIDAGPGGTVVSVAIPWSRTS